LILGIALVHLLLMSVFVVDMIARQYKFLHHQSRQQALSLANELAVTANTHVLGNDFDGLERVIQNYKNFPDLKYAMILAPDNEVLSHTDLSYVGKTALDSVSRRIGKEPGSHILLADDEIVDAVAPVTQAGATIAWARVAISQDYIYSNLTAILRNGVFYILAAIAIGTLVGILMGNRLTRGLYKLVAAAEKIRAGDRNLRAADSDSFEVGRLAVAFNQMLDDIDARGSILESIFQNNEGAIGLYDKDLRYVLFNRQFAENHYKMTGKFPVAGEPLYSDFPSEVIEQRRALVQNVLKGKKEVVEANYLIDGRRAYYRTSFNPVLVDGEITGVTTNTINLTAIKEAEAELKESEEKFRTLVEQSQVGVYILQDSRFVYVNPLIERISGYSAAELMRMERFDEIVHKEDRQLSTSKYENRLDGKAPTDDYVLRVVKKDGSIAYIQTIASRIIYRNEMAVLGSVIDITDKLQENNRLNKSVIDAQEKERIQIGMELHDNVQQILAGAMLTLDFVFGSYDDRTEALNALRDIKQYLNDGMVELRRISHQLAPSIRWEQNLEDKIRALVETMNIGRSADVKLEIDQLGQPLSQEIQLAFYRILQEQLTNILKYAHASLISIRLEKMERMITLSIKDNGQGFDPATKKSGIGLENIRRRVAALEGEMKIVSSVGNGCELLVQAPAI
jgi:PAS domain S-box-containing protein